MTRTASWRPLLEGDLAEQALGSAREIAASLVEYQRSPPAGQQPLADLANGDAGRAVFLAYAEEAFPDRGLGVAVDALIDQAISRMEGTRMGPQLFGGFTGIAWMVAHLGAAGDFDPNAPIDEMLLARLQRGPWEHSYDLIEGLVGLGVYALERGDRGRARELLGVVVDRLETLSIPDGVGRSWHTPARLVPEWQRTHCPKGYFNLGMAHGVPGVVALLARSHAAGVRPDVTRTLLDHAVPWLLGEALPSNPDARYPMWRGDHRETSATRSGWCYGDPGVAAAILLAARRLRKPDWERFALELARGVTRRDPEAVKARDPGLCHGAAGLGHLLNRIYQATGDDEIGAAATSWFERCLAMRKPDDGIAGYLAFNPGRVAGELEWQADPGFLTGAAGVGLALLAATTELAPGWDRCLLLDVEEAEAPP